MCMKMLSSLMGGAKTPAPAVTPAAAITQSAPEQATIASPNGTADDGDTKLGLSKRSSTGSARTSVPGLGL